MSRPKILAALAISCLMAPVAAKADIITALNGGPVAQLSGGFAYTYNVSLTSQQQLDPASNGNIEFGTVYDFGPIIGNISSTGILASSFSFSMANSFTPANQTAPTDNPNLLNIRFTYQGSTAYYVTTTTNANATQLPATADNLGTFTVISPYNTLNTSVQYDGQALKGTNDTITGNVGYTSGPSIPTQVPEPISLSLLGAGLVTAGLVRRRRR